MIYKTLLGNEDGTYLASSLLPVALGEYLFMKNLKMGGSFDLVERILKDAHYLDEEGNKRGGGGGSLAFDRNVSNFERQNVQIDILHVIRKYNNMTSITDTTTTITSK